MIKEFIIGTKYYLKVDFSKVKQYLTERFEMYFIRGGKVKTSGNNSWVNFTESTITFNTQNRIELDVDNVTQTNITGFEIVAELTGISFYSENSLNEKYLKSVAIDNPVEFHLYTTTREFNVAPKVLQNEIVYYGVFKEETDVLNPTILIESDSFITSNYAYLPSFIRYYYIVGITCVRKNLYRLQLKVDVLKSFYPLLREGGAGLVNRSENEELYDNGDLVDDRLPLEDIPQIEIMRTSNAGGTKNVSFRPDNISYSEYYIAVTVMNDTQRTLAGSPRQRPTGTGLQHISGCVIDNPTLVTYFLDRDKFEKLAYRIENKQSLGSFIVSVVYFPFDIAQIDGERDENNNLKTMVVRVNNEDISSTFAPLGTAMQSYYSYSNVSSYLIISDQTYDIALIPHLKTQAGLKFLNYEPYSTYQIYIPYHGWEDVRGYDIVNQRILTFYVADYSSGMARWYLYNETKRYVITSGSCELGSRVAISATNMYELINQKLQNTSNTMLATIGSIATTTIGFMTKNPVMISGGIIGGASALTGGVNKDNMILGQGNVSSGGDSFGYYSNNMSYIKHTYRNIHNETETDLSEYWRNNGIPSHKYILMNEYGDNELAGYIEMSDIHISTTLISGQPTITKTEMDELTSLLKTGVYL